MSFYTQARLVLPDPLWIVTDDSLGELEWALRSWPLPHLAIGFGLVEELRSIRKPLTNQQLGKILQLELEGSNYRHYWHGQDSVCYVDTTRSNFISYAAEHPQSAKRLSK